MNDQRLIVEMGMGVDLHGGDYTKAARRAVDDALHHSSMPILRSINFDKKDTRVRVTIGVQNPKAVDIDEVAQILPHENVEIVLVTGGLDVADPTYGGGHVIATAAVELFLPKQDQWKLCKS